MSVVGSAVIALVVVVGFSLLRRARRVPADYERLGPEGVPGWAQAWTGVVPRERQAPKGTGLGPGLYVAFSQGGQLVFAVAIGAREDAEETLWLLDGQAGGTWVTGAYGARYSPGGTEEAFNPWNDVEGPFRAVKPFGVWARGLLASVVTAAGKARAAASAPGSPR